jgi:outer membrane protein assembly factor BamB
MSPVHRLLTATVTFAAAVTLLLVGTVAARAGTDWPMYRGNPSLSGVSTAQLPAKLKLLWTFKSGGPVLSSPAVVGDRVYFGSADSNLYCLRLADGARQWAFPASGPLETSPLVLDGRLYFGDLNTNFYCVEALAGKEVWKYGFDDKVKSSANWYLGADGKTKNVVVGSYDFKLYSFNAVSGRTNWVYETGNYINGSPAVADGQTAFGGCDAIVHVVRLADGQKTAEIEAGAYIIGSAALLDGKAYVGHYENEFLCVDLRAGKVAWRYRDRAFPYSTSPAVTADRVLFGGRDKRLHCVKRETGEAVWVFPTRGKVESSPVVVGDKVVFGSDDGRLYLLNLADGKELWQYELGQPVQSSPAVVDGHVLIGCDDGQLYCFGRP